MLLLLLLLLLLLILLRSGMARSIEAAAVLG